jgi:hypothetical protein
MQNEPEAELLASSAGSSLCYDSMERMLTLR